LEVSSSFEEFDAFVRQIAPGNCLPLSFSPCA
jgi:hypothetical protein